jgi:hypothetical protein
MKKYFLLLFVASLGTLSCTKTRTCECDIAGVKTSYPYEGVSKSEAEDACAALDAIAKTAGGTSGCELK